MNTGFVYYVAAPGEANDVVVGQVDAQTISVRDAGATIDARNGCTAIDAHNARCVSAGASLAFALVETGDMNDRIRSFGNAPPLLDPQLSANGGAGDDELIGGESADDLSGGGGHDRLLGGAGPDILRDDDYDKPDADVFVGGPDLDAVDYSQRPSPMNIDLRDATTPEGDKLVSIENVYSGDGADRLTGDGYANTLLGGGGADTMFCGGGRDLAFADTRRDFVAPDCERVALDVPGVVYATKAYPVTAGAGSVRFLLGCPGYPEPCSAKVTLRETRGRSRLLGTGSLTSRGYKLKRVRVKLTKAGRRLAHRRAGVRATVTLKGTRLPSVGWTIRLRLAG